MLFQIQVKYAMHIVLIYAKENEATRSRFEPIRKLALYSPSAHVYIHAQCASLVSVRSPKTHLHFL